MKLAPLLLQFFDVAALLSVPPLLLGVINRTKAVFAGRRGPPLTQPYRDLVKLSRKGSVFSRTTTWIFRASPVVTLVATVMAGLLVPLGAGTAALGFQGDLILFAYLFALGRFFTTAAALDTGSPFEGMGAAREVTFACLAEPAIFFVLLCLVRLSGSLSLGTMIAAPADGHVPSVVLCIVGLLVVLLLETSRVPFDDPNTHLELTMVHEVMVLDHSGPLLGAIEYGAAVKLFVLGTIVVRLALPAGMDPWAGRAALLVGLGLLAIGVGIVESVTSRVRLTKVPNLIAAATLLTAFAFLLMVR
ncbi:MAG TPA: NADH-quinone oxidoreductase subunit H [Longimicrobiales bacterium]|nr:NADH-quinone oxidoreductase subunit H [Longimicrobiales bacterium]